MMILILLLLVAVFTLARKKRKDQAEVRYWARIHELEAQRKEQVLATAIKRQRQKKDDEWRQAS